MKNVSASFDLSADLILVGGETRAEIRSQVKPESPPNKLIPTLEVTDDWEDRNALRPGQARLRGEPVR